MNKNESNILIEAIEQQEENNIEDIMLHTNIGSIDARYHISENADSAIIWVGGAGGGLTGPAGGLYPRIAENLVKHQIASLRLDYRFPNNLENCVIDTLVGLQYLQENKNLSRFALVGHSFGGAVVISAAALHDKVVTVAALSSQLYGTNLVGRISPRSLLLIHGVNDEILAPSCSEEIYKRAKEPKKIILYPGCRHGLDECREQLDYDLQSWLMEKLLPH